MKDSLNFPTDGETALAVPIGDDLALVSGVAESMPDSVEVLLNGDPSMAMRATVVSWKREGAPAEAAIGFLALVSIDLARKVRLRSIIMRLPGYPSRYALVRQALDLEGMMKIVASDAGAAFADVADGAVQALVGTKTSRRRAAAAQTVLTSAARTDGWIEVMGAVDTGEIFVQGWANNLPVDTLRVVANHSGFVSGSLCTAAVERGDLSGSARGFVGLIDSGNARLEPEALKRVFFRTGEGWLSLDVYERKVLLAPTDVPAHIRDGLARASAKPDTLRRLRRAGDRFDGRDTVSVLHCPLRIGMDMVVDVPGGGVLVAGWLLDPEGHADSVSLRAGSFSARVDETWTRLPRPDVSTAFQHNDLFAGRLDPQRNDHGFLAFVPGLTSSADVPLYLEFALGDAVAFYPLKPFRSLSRRTLERLVSPLDPRTAAAGAAIERHIGPMMQALASPEPCIVETHDFGFDDADADRVLVIGAGHDPEEVSVSLAHLALDPEVRGLPIIVSAPVESFDSIAPEAGRLARFYGIQVRVIGSEGVQDTCDALEAAVQATEAEALVFLAAGVLPRKVGWLSALERAYRKRGGRALVSPTIVFEDNSIRFAGTWLDRETQSLVDRYIGYPHDVIRTAEPSEVVAGTTSCCIVSRKAVAAAGGFTRSYLGAGEKGRDLCLKLRLEGTPSVWLPDVEMISADEGSAASPPIRRLAQRIDRWSFDRKWSLLINNMR